MYYVRIPKYAGSVSRRGAVTTGKFIGSPTKSGKKLNNGSGHYNLHNSMNSWYYKVIHSKLVHQKSKERGNQLGYTELAQPHD